MSSLEQPEIIYVDEYQSSSAVITIGQDPIYIGSNKKEQLRIVTAAVPPNLTPILLIGGALLLLVFLSRDNT